MFPFSILFTIWQINNSLILKWYHNLYDFHLWKCYWRMNLCYIKSWKKEKENSNVICLWNKCIKLLGKYIFCQYFVENLSEGDSSRRGRSNALLSFFSVLFLVIQCNVNRGRCLCIRFLLLFSSEILNQTKNVFIKF